MAKYKVVGMLVEAGMGKDLHSGVSVDYKTARMRRQYEVTVHDGKLWHSFAPMDTTHVSNDVYLFVMDEEGTIYSGSQSDVEHHSAFLAGHPVAAAGTISVHNGLLQEIYDQSGHYQPPLDYTEQFVKELKARGIAVTDTMKRFQGRKKSDLKKGYKQLGLATGRIYQNNEVKKKCY